MITKEDIKKLREKLPEIGFKETENFAKIEDTYFFEREFHDVIQYLGVSDIGVSFRLLCNRNKKTDELEDDISIFFSDGTSKVSINDYFIQISDPNNDITIEEIN